MTSWPTSPITMTSETVEPVNKETNSYWAQQGKWKLLVHLTHPETSHLSKSTRLCWIRFGTNRCALAVQWGINESGTHSEKEHFLQPLQAGNEVKRLCGFSWARCSLLALNFFLCVHLTQATHTLRHWLSSKPLCETLPPFQRTKLQDSSEWSLLNEFPFLLP